MIARRGGWRGLRRKALIALALLSPFSEVLANQSGGADSGSNSKAGLEISATSNPAEAPLAFDPAPSSKVLNRTLFTPPEGMEAGEQIFLTNDMRKPLVGACEKVPAHAAYVEEMLVNIDSIGSPGGKTYQRRVALVVGNGAYEAMRDLENPKNDATSMAKLMHLLGFDVYYAADVKAAALESCLSKFKADLEGKPADVALFYYAGHGVQLTQASDGEKRNYMLSVDAKVDAAGKSYGFKQIDAALDEMRAHAKQSVFLYDACRNSPIGQDVTVVEADGGAVTRQADLDGAAQVEVKSTDSSSAPQLFIAYATSPGKTADDAGPNGSKHSPFTQALLNNLATPGVIIEEALANAYYDVGEKTGGRQTPWTSSSLQKRLQLNGATPKADVQIKSEQRAASSENHRTNGLRGNAIAEALKGMPPHWQNGEAAAPFANARAELYRAMKEQEVVLSGHSGDVSSAEFTADGSRIVSASSDGTAMIWDARTGERLDVLLGHNESVTSAAFSPDGRRIVTASWDKTAKIWDAVTNLAIRSLEGHANGVSSAAFNDDGRRVVTASYDGTAVIWNADTGAKIRSLKGHKDAVTSAAFDHDGKQIVTASYDGTAIIWESSSGRPIKVFAIDDRVSDAAFSFDGGRIVTASWDKTASIWDAKSGDRLAKLVGHRSLVRSAAFSRDGTRIVTGSGDGSAKIWSAKTGALIDTFEGHDGDVSSAAFNYTGDLLITASLDRKVRVWGVARGRPVATWRHNDEFTGVAYSNDGELIALTTMGALAHILDSKTGESFHRLEGHRSAISSVAFSPDDAQIVTSSWDKTAKIWNVSTGAPVMNLDGHEEIITSAAYSPNGAYIVTASYDGTARVWDAGAGTPLTTYKVGGGWVTNAVFNCDSVGVVTSATNGTVKIWDRGSEAAIRTVNAHNEIVTDVNFGRRCSRLVTGSSDGTARIWDAESSMPLTTIAGHRRGVQSALFAADGWRIATTSLDRTVRIWDADTGAVLSVFEGGSERVAADFSPNGRYLVTASNEGMIRIWETGIYGPEMLDAAKAQLTPILRDKVERERIRYWEVDTALVE